jgi:hypothetical protein
MKVIIQIFKDSGDSYIILILLRKKQINIIQLKAEQKNIGIRQFLNLQKPLIFGLIF